MLHEHPFLDAAVRVAIAFLLGLPVGFEQEKRTRSVGLRTYPLLSAGICGFLVTARGDSWGAIEQADVIYGVLNGIGFVGAGAIVRSPQVDAASVSVAVSLWVAGAIGVGVAYGAPLISAALSLATVLVLWAPFLHRRVKRRS